MKVIKLHKLHFQKVKCCKKEVHGLDYESFVPERIAKLRQTKGVSARDMSLSIGQNVNYINHIEN